MIPLCANTEFRDALSLTGMFRSVRLKYGGSFQTWPESAAAECSAFFLTDLDPRSHSQLGGAWPTYYHLVAIDDTDAHDVGLPPVSKRMEHGGKIGSNGALTHKVHASRTKTTVTVRTSSRPSPGETG
jgi:hypothetical protein